LSGHIGFGVAGFDVRSNLGPGPDTGNLDLSRATITSLDAQAPGESDAMAIVPFDFRYTFSSRHTQAFLGTALEDLAQFDFPLQAGIRHQFQGEDIVSISGVTSAVPTLVWSDPYVLNQERRETERRSSGVRLEWDRILGTEARIRYTQRNVEIDDELSGTVQLGLPADEVAALDREGELRALVLAYDFKPGDRHTLEPQLVGIRGDLDGAAMAYDYAELKLTHTYQGDRVSVVSTASMGRRDYDATNPVFGITRSDDTIGVGSTLIYPNMFGSRKWMGLASLAVYREDANIDFYDGEVTFAALALLYRL
jgi:hypothetical protein